MNIRPFVLMSSLLASSSFIPLTWPRSISAGAHSQAAENPFSGPSKLPFQAPAFDKIIDADFKPALEEGIRHQQNEIDMIAANAEPATFANTLEALEESGQMLNRAKAVFNLLNQANTNPVLQKTKEEEAPKLAANDDALYLNTKLFERIEAVYKQRQALKLTPEAKRLVEFYEQRFELSGAGLSEPGKDSLRQLNQEEATLSAVFTNHLLAATKASAVVITNSNELDGLSPGSIMAAEQTARQNKLNGNWVLSLQNTTQQPALQSLSNRKVRQRLFEASYTRAEKQDSNDTRKIIQRIAQLRAQKAHILHFNCYAEWKLKDQMAQTPAAVDSFMARLVPAATAKARSEANAIQELIDKQRGSFKLAPWDWNFYAEQIRRVRFDLDENEVKPYFELNNVLKNGVFYAAGLLYGISFEERKDLPVYQQDVRVFTVLDQDHKPLGLFYCDYFKRDNKAGGAWMSNLVTQSKLLGTLPVIYNVCNFTKPALGQPALISYSDATTMFHEFGHGLHGLFASQVYPSISGAHTARDFVEFPSQFNEHWALDPKVFAHYAIHYKTGLPMPKVLVAKIKKAATFNQGYALSEALAAASLDFKWHSLPATAGLQDVDSFEAKALRQTKLDLREVPPRYRSSYFLHIWSNGYAAGYYAYAWTEMLDDDAFAWFEQHGGLTRANGQRFRNMILSRGNTEDYRKMFRDFAGRDPEIGPMLKHRGI